MTELHPFLVAKYPELPQILALADANDQESQHLKAKFNGQLMQKRLRLRLPEMVIEQQDYQYTTPDGYQLTARLFKPAIDDNPKGRLIILIHGGGMNHGSNSDYQLIAKQYAILTRLPVVTIGYRLAPLVTAETIIEDVTNGVKWAQEHTSKWQLNRSEIVLLGLSSGGGLAMSVSLLAKRRGLKIARQMLIYPMLDDANVVPKEDLVGKISWTYAMNKNSWQQYLGTRFRSINVDPILIPAHDNNFYGLEPTYIDVGTCDIFCQEDMQLARRLKANYVKVTFHMYEGLPHAFEIYGDAPYMQRIINHRIAFLRG